MSFSLHFLPEVEEDVSAGYTWYEGKSTGLGEEFLRSFYAASGEILPNPNIYQKVYQDFRRCLLRRFPYAIYFLISEDQIIIFGLIHCARDPRTVKSKLKNRK